MVHNIGNWLAGYGINISKSGIEKAVTPGIAVQFANELINSIGSVFKHTILILITVLFMLLEAWNIPKKIERACGENAAFILQISNKAVLTTREYMTVKALTNLIMAVLIGIGLLIAAIPAILISLIKLGTVKTVFVALAYFIVNVVVDFFIQPKLLGSKTGLSMLAILLSLFFWSWVLGLFGLILAIPLTLIFKYAIATYRERN